MPRSYWKLHLDAKKEESANKILSKCIKLIGRPPIESEITKYSKGGYMADLQIYHHDQLSWPEIVIEVTGFGETLGGSWSLFGQINSNPNAVLSKESSNSRIVVPGLLWATWEVINE
ncbi:MAG: hypothetical protein CR955_00365 [Thiotrichales bacterium]|nr:MAG: hypothetical protein CR955_00365 [Thiotrichales bacterium]